mmetsp:Transcript_35489/g.82887  ORF Transcript_35489/g.82887 Transcript_35489/m.82887 type:complete len:220 (-) Transcript_35489:148-807(-)
MLTDGSLSLSRYKDSHQIVSLCRGIGSEHRLSDSEGLALRVPPILGVSAALSTRAKWLFVGTNIPYWGVALYTLGTGDVAPAPLLECALTLCASGLFHGTVIALLAAVSTGWHSAQCSLAEWLCVGDVCDLHSPRWLWRLLVCDISCSVATMGMSIVCFGPARTLGWLSVPLVVFLLGRRAKIRREYRLYAIWHGLWHLLSAAAISQIVANDVIMPRAR